MCQYFLQIYNKLLRITSFFVERYTILEFELPYHSKMNSYLQKSLYSYVILVIQDYRV